MINSLSSTRGRMPTFRRIVCAKNRQIIARPSEASKVSVTGGLNNVNTDANWTHAGDTYSQAGSGPTINITVDMGVGSLKLVNK